MAAQGYIGRAPGESSVVVARQTFTPTGITTNFTFASGYEVGYVDAYLNGARLIEGDDYTATDGSVVGLTTHAINGDVLELVAYKAFNLANVTGANGDFIVPDKIIHKEDTDTAIRFPQADTFTVETAGSEVFRVDANGNVGIGTTNTLRIADPKNQSGINVGFITANSITAAAGSFGSLNVSGTLSYEDVANQDVVGFATFQKGIIVQGAGSTTTTLNVTGVSSFAGNINANGNIVGDNSTNISGINQITATTFSGDGSGLTGVASTDNIITGTAATFNNNVNIAGSIFHVGDTNTAFGFPAADTFTVYTGGSEAIRVDSGSRLLIGDTGSYLVNGVSSKLQVSDAGGPSRIMTIRTEDGANGSGIQIAKSRNGAIVQDDDQLGGVFFIGHDGTDLASQAAQIVCHVDGAPGSNDMPGRLVFKTTADGAAAATERLRITSAGRIGIGTAEPDRLLVVAGSDPIIRSEDTDTGNNYAEFKQLAGSLFIDSRNDSSDGTIIFRGVGGGSATEKLRIGPAGQIGIAGANYGTSGQVLTSKGSGSAVAWEDASGGGGITTTKYSPAANAIIQIGLGTAQHHELRLSAGFTTVTTSGGSFGDSHSLVLVQPSSGICTVGFSTFFQFPSGATPSMSEGGGKVDLVSFVVKDIARNAGTGATELLASAGLNYQ
jgi:hypothetical protein